MAHGLPDWYRGVDIAYQALAMLITRPTYGGAMATSGFKTVTASSSNAVVTVTGEGMLYGGHIYLTSTGTQQNDQPILQIDSQNMSLLTWSQINARVLTRPESNMLFESKYDNVNFIYSAGIEYGITFETNIILQYVEAHGRTPTVWYKLLYALT